jgi:hypothetical protein
MAGSAYRELPALRLQQIVEQPWSTSTADLGFAFEEAVAAYAAHPCQVNVVMVEMTVLALRRQKERAAALARWRGLAGQR